MLTYSPSIGQCVPSVEFQLVLEKVHLIGLNHSSVDQCSHCCFHTLTFIKMDFSERGNLGKPPCFVCMNYACYKSLMHFFHWSQKDHI